MLKSLKILKRKHNHQLNKIFINLNRKILIYKDGILKIIICFEYEKLLDLINSLIFNNLYY
jgi:hypothetical protein